MSDALLLDPHGDDAVLFSCFNLLRHQPHVLVTDRTVPREEINEAMDVLGVSWSEGRTIWPEPDLLILPAFEREGHAEHNRVANSFAQMSVPKIEYFTYAPRGQRSRWGQELVPEPKELALKLRALSCFHSQIELETTRPWFFSLLDLREWAV